MPCFYRMSETQPVQLTVGVNHTVCDPSHVFFIQGGSRRCCAVSNGCFKCFVDGHSIASVLYAFAQTSGNLEIIGKQHCSWIRTPPEYVPVIHKTGIDALFVTDQNAFDRKVASQRNRHFTVARFVNVWKSWIQ